jgi:hypothetical protein
MVVEQSAPTLWQTASQLPPPNFSWTLASTVFGLLVSAWLTSRAQKKKEMVAELNSISAALVLCFSITNIFLGLKRQIIRPMRDRFIHARLQYNQARQNRGAAQVMDAHLDLQAISPVRAPTGALERYVFEKISIRGRPLAAVVTLVGAIDGLGQAIKYRNELVTEFREGPRPEPKVGAERYFGLRTADGAIDERFCVNIQAISNQTDDCIFFSRLLAEDLLRYGRKLRRRHARKLMMGLPRVEGRIGRMWKPS